MSAAVPGGARRHQVADDSPARCVEARATGPAKGGAV